MRLLVCLLVLLTASPAMARTAHAGWVQAGQASYARADYGRAGPAPRYYAPGTAVVVAAPGMGAYTSNGVRVWYGTVLQVVPVLTTGPVVATGPALRAPDSPGPRMYRSASGVRVWYGSGY
ncbi:MAG: hypothetical protein QM759_05945 [Terricaulis sp.]